MEVLILIFVRSELPKKHFRLFSAYSGDGMYLLKATVLLALASKLYFYDFVIA